MKKQNGTEGQSSPEASRTLILGPEQVEAMDVIRQRIGLDKAQVECLDGEECDFRVRAADVIETVSMVDDLAFLALPSLDNLQVCAVSTSDLWQQAGLLARQYFEGVKIPFRLNKSIVDEIAKWHAMEEMAVATDEKTARRGIYLKTDDIKRLLDSLPEHEGQPDSTFKKLVRAYFDEDDRPAFLMTAGSNPGLHRMAFDMDKFNLFVFDDKDEVMSQMTQPGSYGRADGCHKIILPPRPGETDFRTEVCIVQQSQKTDKVLVTECNWAARYVEKLLSLTDHVVPVDFYGMRNEMFEIDDKAGRLLAFGETVLCRNVRTGEYERLAFDAERLAISLAGYGIDRIVKNTPRKAVSARESTARQQGAASRDVKESSGRENTVNTRKPKFH